jgi:hypothetical protein
MNTQHLRPRVAELSFHLYNRPLHPELFDSLCVRQVSRPDCTVLLRLTPSGYVLTLRDCLGCLSEVIADRTQPLPSKSRLRRHRLHGEHHEHYPDHRYQMSSQVEVLPAEVFAHEHATLLTDGPKRGLLHRFGTNARLALAPLSLVVVEVNSRYVQVSTFHTFPDELTLVKTQSLIDRA